MEPPPGYNATTLAQVMKADRQVFAFLAQEAADIRPVGNVKPLDAAIERAPLDYNTTFHLLPLPKAAASDSAVPPRRYDSVPYGGKSFGKGKSKAPGKGKGSGVAPRGYVGCVGRDAKNRRICFNYNLGL